MTTEVLAALLYSPACQCRGGSSVTPYQEGRMARASGSALLSVPYDRLTAAWKDWRTGWFTSDLEEQAVMIRGERSYPLRHYHTGG